MTSPLDTRRNEQLLAQRRALLEQIAQARGGLRSRAESAADAQPDVGDSPAAVATARDLAISLDERELAELAQIDAALDRLAAGTYGRCTDCDAVIPDARLDVAPEAARCIQCQSQAEHAHPGH